MNPCKDTWQSTRGTQDWQYTGLQLEEAQMESRTTRKDSLMVGEGVLLEGKVTTSGSVDIRGILKGEIKADSVHVWESGTIEGSVFANSMEVEGSVSSNVFISGELSVRASGVVSGAISYQRIEIEKGAIVRGKLSCVVPASAPQVNESEELVRMLLQSRTERKEETQSE